MDPEHGLAHGAERVGKVELRLHHAFEEVGRFAEDDSFDIGESHVGVVKSPEDGFTHEATEGHVETAGLVVGLADADDGARQKRS